jgi:acyl carrier protein
MIAERLAAQHEATRAIAQVLRIPARTVTESASLLDLPGFDSITVVAVLERMENIFEIEIPPELIVPEAFESLETLADLFVRGTSASAR